MSLENLIKSCKITEIYNIVKSEEDKCLYRGMKLENEMKVLLISDSVTDKSACCMTLEVGNMCDNDEIPGIAHFLEHMLLLGTEKYPNEDEYTSYLSKNNGSFNANTTCDTTNYFFDVCDEKFESALDRFAQFFISPLFTESATMREINSVHSEYEKNLLIDSRRITQVQKVLANKKHPYSRFGSGNRDTLDPNLNGLDTRSELIQFYEKYYSSNLMSLAIYSKHSLDELENLVVKYFSEIKNKNVSIPKWSDDDKVFLDNQLMTKLYVIPVKNIRKMIVSFEIPSMDAHYKSDAKQYVSHLIGHEGKGSILSLLKQLGWSNKLGCDDRPKARNINFIEIVLDLTNEGLEHIDEILNIIFQYLKLLKKKKLQKWFFDEYRKLGEMQFRFKDRKAPLDFVSSITHQMTYPLQDVLTANYVLTEWRPDLIEEILEKLNPKNCRVTIAAKKFNDKCVNIEKWYQSKYYVEKIGQSLIDEWMNCETNIHLHLPDPNLFIPSDFALVPLENCDDNNYPMLIDNTSQLKVWYKQDNKFLKPKMFIGINFHNPKMFVDPLSYNLTNIYVSLLNDTINEYIYAAELADLHLEILVASNEIKIKIMGFSDNQINFFLDTVLNKMFNFEMKEDRFRIICEQYLRELKNFEATQPYQIAFHYLNVILTSNEWTMKELIEAMSSIQMENLNVFIKDVIKDQLNAECLIYGNVNKEKSLEIAKLIRGKLENSADTENSLKREYKLIEGEENLFEVANEINKNSCTCTYLQCGSQENINDVVLLDLITQILSDKCINILRTQEQLGYIVDSGVRKENGVNGFMILVQTSKNLDFIDSRIENFLTSMASEIDKMSNEDFEKQKNGLKAAKLEKPANLKDQFLKYFHEISAKKYKFDRNENEAEILTGITKSQVLNFYNEFIVSPMRKSLTVHVISAINSENIDRIDNAHEAKKFKKVNDIASFKSSIELFN